MTHKATKKTYRFRRDGKVWILDAIVDINSLDTVFRRKE